MSKNKKLLESEFSRRAFLGAALVGSSAALFGSDLIRYWKIKSQSAETFIGQADSYSADLCGIIKAGFKEIGVLPAEIKGKRILLKPNLVETSLGSPYINTHPMVVRGAIEAFLSLGAGEVIVGEGPGHCRDSLLLLEESGLSEVLYEDRIKFVDLNYDEVVRIPNLGKLTTLQELVVPKTLHAVDWIVSLAKLKTHHWAGVTLSMKNLFGVMPGSYYGWPKNVLHYVGLQDAILDIYASIKPHFAIVDGIIGMEGDGPIMGTPKDVGVLVMGRDFSAVDASCSRLMGIDPHAIPYLAKSEGWLGSLSEDRIFQRGELIKAKASNFSLVEGIPAHANIRLSSS